MASLLEAYAKRIKVAEGIYAKNHDGDAMTRSKQLTLACVLNNSNKFLTEKFNAAGSEGTQASAIKTAKRFVMNLTNIVLPNLIAEDLVMVQPWF